MDEQTKSVIAECQRQEESCLYTSTALFEWLKSLRMWRTVFVVAPIVLGGIAAWPLLKQQTGYELLTGLCALLAGVIPSIYKALDFDVSLERVGEHAHKFKVLQDRFRQTWRVLPDENADFLKTTFDNLMDRMDDARAASLTPPERFFKRARKKIEKGDYSFAVDAVSEPPPAKSS